MPEIDAAFTNLPLRRLADAALSRAKTLGADHADIRVERIKDSRLSLHDARLDGTSDGEDVGFAVRVLLDGSWGFASHVDLTPESAERVAEQAIEVAKVSRPLSTQRIELADEPAYGDVTWVSPYEVDPFSVPDSDKISLLADWSSGLLAHDIVAHADASVHSVVENKFYSDLAGTTTTQQRVRIQCQLEALGIDKVPASLDAVLDRLEVDHDYLIEGGVFTPDLIETWIEYKREFEIDPIRLRPHPHEFAMYYDI